MIPKDCKRLAEVDFPIAVVSKHSAREKSIRHGHPSTLHLWWARRPLAACRAMLLGLLLPDPCDPLCPEDFKKKARALLPATVGQIKPENKDLRRAMLKFIGDFANWDMAANRTYLDVSRGLVKAAHPDETPLVVDPFAGGGSIPLEALRLGCEAFASDLNPVACLILKVMLEDIPRHGPELAKELRRVGGEIKKAAEKELAEFYPKDADGATPIAYLWARTVRCESPNCGAEIPLARSFWLCTKANRRRALKYEVVRPKGEAPHVEFDVFEPKGEKDVPSGTVTRGNAACPCCNMVLPVVRVRAQLAEQRGGADVIFGSSAGFQPAGKEKGGKGSRQDACATRTGGAIMTAVVTLHPGMQGRHYRLPTERDYQAVWKAQKRLKAILDEWERGGKQGLCPVPDEPLPPIGTLGFRVQRYGMLQWGDLFTARQKNTFVFLSKLIGSTGASHSVNPLLAMVCTKLADRCNSLVNWSLGVECPNQLFKGNAVPIGWDFAESNLLSDSSASLAQSIENIARNVEAACIQGAKPTSPQMADACEHPLPDHSSAVLFTDPPYYDAVPYSDLSDFFLVWFKRALPGVSLLRDRFDPGNLLSPKDREVVQDETKVVNGQAKDRVFFEERMALAFTEGCRILREDGIGSVVFAHKTTEGWEALLSGMIKGGWVITGSWPIATERYSRIRARDSAALATSIHLVCRPRVDTVAQASSLHPDSKGRQDACATTNVGDWGEVLRELPKRVGDWMERLQAEGIRGADLVFACIGPALEIFSRYRKVETADGREVKLAEYLVKVWEVVGRSALEQVLGTAEAKARNGAAGALEEDARLTALFLWTLQSTDVAQASSLQSDERGENDEEDDAGKMPALRGFTLPFDVARRFAQPLGVDLPKWEGRIIETKKGVVRLLPVAERAEQLFGEDGAEAVAHQLERDPAQVLQQSLFPELDAEPAPRIRGRKKGRIVAQASSLPENENAGTMPALHATTLDRVHAAMLLQAGGQTNGLRALIKAEQERGPDFLRLANALSALYPSGSEEKRLLDAMLLAIPR